MNLQGITSVGLARQLGPLSIVLALLAALFVCSGSAQAQSVVDAECATREPFRGAYPGAWQAWHFVPFACERVRATNPAFVWPVGVGAPPYRFEIKRLGKVVLAVDSVGNWLRPEIALAPGSYTWTVTGRGAAPQAQRSFIVEPGAGPADTVDVAAVLTAVERERPISVPTGDAGLAWRGEIRAERRGGFDAMLRRAAGISYAPELEPTGSVSPGAVTASSAQQMAVLRVDSGAVRDDLLAGAYATYLSGDAVLGQRARAALLAVATWDADGATGHRSQDQANRAIALAMAVSFDLLHAQLSPSQRSQVVSAVMARLRPMAADLIRNGRVRLEMGPYDSHGWTNLAYLSAISSLIAAEDVQAREWLLQALPFYMTAFDPWGGDDGGYAGGPSYAMSALDLLMPVWDVLKHATGVSAYTLPRTSALGRFVVHMYPPGSVRSAFGDGAEMGPAPRVLTALAKRVRDPLLDWYVQAQPPRASDASWLPGLLAPPEPEGVEGKPIGMERYMAAFASVGVVVSHDDLFSPAGYSLYFRSSAYGAYGHAHGDNNAIALHARKTPLLIDSGRYDWYGSPHWKTWYRQTVAHNAVTFDGGVGQAVNGVELSLRNGASLLVASHSKTIDRIEGDARVAYGGALKHATRRIWHLRSESAVLIEDVLESSTPRVFEWNAHALAPFVSKDEGMRVAPVGGAVCLRPLMPDNAAFENRNGINYAAQSSEKHGYYRMAGVTTHGRFLVLVDIGCRRPAVQVVPTEKGFLIRVGDEEIVLDS